jgi:probable HAF family extracellular repeat protein
MAPTAPRSTRHARRLLPTLGVVFMIACGDETPLAPREPAGAPLAAAAGLDVVSVVALEGFLDAAINTSEARDVNDRGQVVGFSSHGVGSGAALWDNSRFATELPSLGGTSMAGGISADGSVIVGGSYDGTSYHAVRWVKPGAVWVVDALPYPYGATSCGASDVSADGTVIAGECDLPDGDHVIVWHNGAVRDMGKGYLGGVSADAAAGTIYTPQSTAVRWSLDGSSSPGSPAVATPIGTLGGTYSNAKGIDASGSIVGITTNAANEERPFLWTARKGMVDVGLLAGTGLAIPKDIAGDRIVGSSYAGSTAHATLWYRGKVADLGALPGYEGANAWAVSPGGLVVGWSTDYYNAHRATMWRLK